MMRGRFILLLAVFCSLGAWLTVRDGSAWWTWATTPQPSPQEVAAATGGRGNWRETATEHGWRLNYAEALAEAREKNKPVMVVLRCIP